MRNLIQSGEEAGERIAKLTRVSLGWEGHAQLGVDFVEVATGKQPCECVVGVFVVKRSLVSRAKEGYCLVMGYRWGVAVAGL